ncbi:hypothetical protein SteCoe_17693 [Stentor coeruleus]|uniref:C2H2-type domain-containing protein n=1 Tax=Stentor coeruleus TaxID=5963 RepID=A0A1R2BYC0_9CILI|nr:hypothetical protein SteCoe_17693 [Stentor coeruleus]
MSTHPSQFQCKFMGCTKSYSSKYNLRRHIESNHSKVKRFRCRKCGKYLSSKQNLQEHRYTHTQEKPYVCKEPLCGKAFRQSSQLSNHKKIHQGLITWYRQQNEFKELKLTSLLKQHTREIQEYTVDPGEEIILLPELSGPQFFVRLTRLVQLN